MVAFSLRLELQFQTGTSTGRHAPIIAHKKALPVSLLVKTAGTLESNLWKLCLQCLTVSTTMHEKNKMKYK